MLKNVFKTGATSVFALAYVVWAVAAKDAQGQGHMHSPGGHFAAQHEMHPAQGRPAPDHAAHGHASPQPAVPAAQPLHGGQIAELGSTAFEVVYLPKETRVYMYGPTRQPVSARGAQGQAVFQRRGDQRTYPYPLTYRAPEEGSADGDYLVAAVDVSRVRDGDMTATIELSNMLFPQQLQARFTQTFALSKVRSGVQVVAFTEADRAGIARQQVCPVMGTKLGDHGTPVKLLIGQQPVYLCCKGCLAKVEANPQHYADWAAKLHGAN